MTHMLIAQKNRKQRNLTALMPMTAQLGQFSETAALNMAENRVDRVRRRSTSECRTSRTPPAPATAPARSLRAVPNDARQYTGNGMPYFVPACALSTIGHEHDQVAEEDREDRLPPVHPLFDHARGQHVGRHAGRHRNPQHRHVASRPAPPRTRHRRHVVAVVRRAGDVGGEFFDAVVNYGRRTDFDMLRPRCA